MTEFTYELPNNSDFLNGVKAVASARTKGPFVAEVIDVLKDGSCEISDTGQFSQKRGDATEAIVNFYIQIKTFSSYFDSIENIKKELSKICIEVMPPSAGYDIIDVNISPILSTKNKKNLTEIQEVVSEENYLNLSEDLIKKGKKMANAYIFLYVLENHVRDYINTTFIQKIGSDYLTKIVIPKNVQSKIRTRKTEEHKKKWLPLRGENDLYYLDFIELADVIINNWEYFKTNIPEQNWIKVKMKEVYDIRCLVAHNSFLSDENIQLLDITTQQLIVQLHS